MERLTSIVSAYVCGSRETLKIYIVPNPVNDRMDFPKTREVIKNVSKSLGNGTYTKLYIEDVGYQKALIQELVSEGIPAEAFKVMGQDKRARLTLITHLIQQGKVLFPRHGCEDLIMQLVGFGIEKYDDLADAFSLLLIKIVEEVNVPECNVYFNDAPGFYDYRDSGLSTHVLEPLSMDTKW